ncbi:hypothetical protein Tco_0853463 [Tanacetum coccineum]
MKHLYRTSHHSESRTPTGRRGLKERLGPRHVRSRSGSPKPRRGRSELPKKNGSERKTVFKRLGKGVFHRLGDKEKSVSVYSGDLRRRSYYSSHRDTESCHQSSRSRTTEPASERRYNKREPSRRAEELLESEGSAGDPFTPRIRYFDFPKTRMPSHIKTYDGSEDSEDHFKIFQSAAKTKRWAMPTWCHMFNSTLTGNARKKCIKDPVEIHNMRQRDGESTEEFVRRYKLECRDVKGAPECMKISEFMHGITNPELIKRLHDKIPKSVDEMMGVTTAFLRGEVAAFNRERKKSFLSWKQQEANQKQNFKKGSFRNQQRSQRKQDRFALLTKTPKEIFALDKGKFKAPPPMTTPVEKRNANKFCEFHGEVGHNTDECMHLRKQIEEMLKAGKLSHLVKEIKQNNEKEQPKVTKKGETVGKDKVMAILMENEGTEGPMFIEAEIGGHYVYHIGEIIWPIGQIQLLVTIGDEEHSASALMNFVVVRSPSSYNGIIRRPRVRKLQAVPSTVHGMLKIPVNRGVITLKSSRLVSLECAMVSGPERTLLANKTKVEERIKVAINPEYPEQTIIIGSTLTEKGLNKLCSLLQQNLDVFSWKPTDMTGVPRHIAGHRLNVRKGCSPVRQKKRGQAANRN